MYASIYITGPIFSVFRQHKQYLQDAILGFNIYHRPPFLTKCRQTALVYCFDNDSVNEMNEDDLKAECEMHSIAHQGWSGELCQVMSDGGRC